MITVPGKFKVTVDQETAETTISGKLTNLTTDDMKELAEQVQAATDIAKHLHAVLNKVSQLEAIERAKNLSAPRQPRRKIPKDDQRDIFIRYRVNKESPKVIGAEYGVADQTIINTSSTWASENPRLAEELLQT